MPVLDLAGLLKDRVDAIRAFHEKIQRQRKLPLLPKAELDSSGGIDSAVMACLLSLALGRENVILFHSRINTHESQTARAVALAKALCIPLVDGHLTGVFNALVAELNRAAVEAGYSQEEIDARCEADPTIMGSIRSTLRAPAGRGINRMLGGGIRHGTGNECEDRFLRYYQKGGDGEVDTNPLAMLSKTEVYQLAFALGEEFVATELAKILVKRDLRERDDVHEVARALLPIMETAPSADLWDETERSAEGKVGHTDEAELLAQYGVPFTYGRVDAMTGEILSIGTIERVARFLDLPMDPEEKDGPLVEDVLFGKEVPDFNRFLNVESLNGTFCFNQTFESENTTGVSFNANLIELLKAARKAEKDTHHKLNPSIPTLGTRDDLVRRGILTNDLTITKES